MGGISGYRNVPTTVQVGTEKQTGKIIIVQNFTNSDSIESLSFQAYKLGITEYQGKPVEIWDFGKPYIFQVVTTNKIRI
jgi:hypothetical protein